MPFNIIRNDITKLKVDAIVNAANTSLLMGGGVCGAIFSAAGADKLQDACDALAPIKTGEAVITPGFDLPAKYVIHTAGPVYQDGKHNEESLLRSCYTRSLELAVKNGCESIAFPLISSGIYGYPKAEALQVATSAIRDFLAQSGGDAENDVNVSLVVFDKTAFAVSEELLGNVKSYIDEFYIEEKQAARRDFLDVEKRAITDSYSVMLGTPMMAEEAHEAYIKPDAPLKPKAPPAPPTAPAPAAMPLASASAVVGASLESMVGNLDEPFSVSLLRLIDASGKTDADIYRLANIDRRLFSKIRSNAQYVPSKTTALAFAIALELTIDQTADLLKRAGYALSHSRISDVIVEYFIKSRKYDVFEINEVLFSYDQPLLGG